MKVKAIYSEGLFKPLSDQSEELSQLRENSEVELTIDIRKRKLSEHPAIGMWADREDMKDSVVWLDEQRKIQFDRFQQ